MNTSILATIKKMLGLDPSYTAFDTDITIHINSALMVLMQLGIGPSSGFYIQGDTTTWEDFLGGYEDLEGAKTYVYLKTRITFDPPQSSFVLTAYQKEIEQLEWRLNVQAERSVASVVTTDD